MKKYVKIPVEVEAMQWTRTTTLGELREFTNNLLNIDDVEEEFQIYDRLHDTWVKFDWDDWIIKGVKGEFYPCAAEVFAATYREAIESVTTVVSKHDGDDPERPPKGPASGSFRNQVTIYPRQYGKQASIVEQMREQGFGIPYREHL